jgi:two-component system response regulator RegA
MHLKLKPTVTSFETDLISRVLRECEGNVSESARELGIHRRTLQRKMRRMEAGGRKNKGKVKR